VEKTYHRIQLPNTCFFYLIRGETLAIRRRDNPALQGRFYIMANKLIRVLLVSVMVAAAACGDPAVRKQRAVERGDALMAQGKYDEAVLEYRNALKVDNRFGDAHFKLAKALDKTQNSRQAAKEYLRAADLLPDRADAQLEAALLMLAGSDFVGARKHADAALKADPKNVEAQLVLANAMAGLKDLPGAVRELEQAMQVAPGDSRPYSSLGTLEASRGNAVAAEAAFRKALQTEPRSVIARIALARFLWVQRRAVETEQVLKEAIEIDRDNDLANRMLAVFYLRQARTSEAETPLLRLVNAKDPGATLTLADLYTRTQRVPKARELYETLKQRESTRGIAVMRLAALDYLANDRQKAFAAVDEALKQTPTNAQLLALKSEFLLKDHRVGEALDTAKKAVEGDAKLGVAQLALAGAQAAAGNIDEAVRSYQEALNLDSRLTPAHGELARHLLALGQLDRALTHARAAVAAFPQDAEARLVLARVLLAKADLAGAEAELDTLKKAPTANASAVYAVSGQLMMAKRDGPGAIRDLDKALELNASNLEALAARLAVDLHFKKVKEGRARLDRAITQNPNSADLLLLAARFEQTAGDTAAAEKYLRTTLERDASNLVAYNSLGQMYLQQHRLDEARKEFEQIVKRKPDSVPARTMVGMILDVQQKHDEAKTIYEGIVKGGGVQAPVAANNLAWIYADRGEQLDLALQLAQDAKQQIPDSAEVNDTLGWVYYKKDLRELAVKTLENSVGKDPKNVMFQYHLGLAYARAGQSTKARRALEEALRLKPDFDGAPEARKALASLKS